VLQLPLPLQNDCCWYIPLAHETDGPHGVVIGCCWHTPFVHRPVLPHEPVLPQRRCGSKAGVVTPTFEQVPAPFRLHAWQVGQLPAEQQTPSVQCVLAHSLLALHMALGPFWAAQLVPAQ